MAQYFDPCNGVLHCFLVATFNTELFWKLFQLFQTVYVSFYACILTVSMCLLWKDDPVKVVSTIFGLPSFLSAAYLDAYPERGRLAASRLYLVVVFV